jgi:hypothetical protein
MSNASSTGTSTRKTISGRGQLLLAGLLAVAIAAVALTSYMTALKPATPANGNNADVAAASQHQPVNVGQVLVQGNASQAPEEPMSADLEAQDNWVGHASCLERLYIQQQLEQDMCEGLCGR